MEAATRPFYGPKGANAIRYRRAMTLERRPRPFELVRGDFLEGTPTDMLGQVAQAFARNVRAAMAGRSGRGFERESGMSNASVIRILKGQVWPDAVTIARLEVATGRSLWPPYRPPLPEEGAGDAVGSGSARRAGSSAIDN